MPSRPRKAAGFTPRPDSAEPFRCAIYTRQCRHNRSPLSSCDVQRDMCADIVRMRGWLLLEDRFDDPGQSSERLDRPAMQRLMHEIEAGRIDRVIVTHIDRLTQKLFDLARLLRFFEKHGVELNVVTDPQYGQTSGNRLMTNTVAAASEFQKELTRERMAESRAALKRKGRRVSGRVPYGNVADKQTRPLVVQRVEAGHVGRMFELAAAGKRPTGGHTEPYEAKGDRRLRQSRKYAKGWGRMLERDWLTIRSGAASGGAVAVVSMYHGRERSGVAPGVRC
ncbi:MAG: hypothetical protein DWQ29_23155 [Planctomycetota bacterium]|nr:MAG: hypothetical protein DWQ29_23155 [Planctomycetota bacterium]